MEFPIKILNQLRPILRGFRKAQKLTQADIAKRLGITQQSYAQLEANPAAASLERLFKVLAILQVDVVLKEREVAEKLVTIPMIDTVKNQSIPSEIKTTVQIPAERYDTNTGCIPLTNAISNVVGQAMLEQQSTAAAIAAMNRAYSDIAKTCSATVDINAVRRADLEQLRGYSAVDSIKRDSLGQSKAFAEVTGLTADWKKLQSYSAVNSIKTALEPPKTLTEIANLTAKLQGCSAAESLKKDFLEKSKAFDDMTNELSFAFSSIKKKR